MIANLNVLRVHMKKKHVLVHLQPLIKPHSTFVHFFIMNLMIIDFHNVHNSNK
jgi:hypothetical protein